jgi:hypothetical protein
VSGRATCTQPHYVVRQNGDRWCVAHATPGLPGIYTVDVDCPNMAAAERECAWLLAEHDRVMQRERQEAVLLGQRDILPRGVWA